MSNANKISPRQMYLIEGSTKILMDTLFFSKEESLQIISMSLKEELQASNVTFEYLELGSLSARQVFYRNLLYRVEKKIAKQTNLPGDRIKNAIDQFMQMFYNSSNKVENAPEE